jgi:hypothetical protein
VINLGLILTRILLPPLTLLLLSFFVEIENLEEPLDKGKLVVVHSIRIRGKEVLKKKKKIATTTSRGKKGKKGKYSHTEHLLPRSNSNIVYLARN